MICVDKTLAFVGVYRNVAIYLVFKIQRLLIVLQRPSPLSRALSFLFPPLSSLPFSPSHYPFCTTLPSSPSACKSSLSLLAHCCTPPNPFVSGFGFSSWVWHIFGWLLWLCAVCGYATLLLSLIALPLLSLSLFLPHVPPPFFARYFTR